MRDTDEVLELRMRRSWLAVVAIAVVVAGAIIVLGCVSILFEGRVDVGGALLIAFILVSLGGLILVPGVAMLVRFARGVPTVRIDETGIVWGRDRSRDLAIDWPDVAEVHVRLVTNQVVPDHLFVIRAGEGRAPGRVASLYGRVVVVLNRSTHATPFAISTVTADRSWEAVEQAIGRHLPGRPVIRG